MKQHPAAAEGAVEPALAPSPGRIKRQVQAREHRFALVCPPGLEAVCLQEARILSLALVPLPGATTVEPGPILEWTGRLEDLYRACLFLRVASRVLVRLASFRAGAREELFRHTGDFPWELWLPSGAILKVEAHVRHSRISHEGMAADTVRQAIDRRLGRAGLAPTQIPVDAAGTELAQRLIVHLQDNHVQLSLDASGDHLHRRAWRTTHGAAPIRENLAAGLLLWAGWPGIPASDQSGEPPCLVDGMCGSGSFAIEAAGLSLGLPASGLATRDYAFCHWPSATKGPLHWWRKQRVSRWSQAGVEEAVATEAGVPVMISAGDIDPAMVSLAADNELRALGTATITWSTGDFFALKPLGRGLLVLNPPYGLRLSDGEGSLYPRLCRHLAGIWPDWHILLLGLPETGLGPLAPRLQRQCRFRHGGLTVAAWLFGPS